MIGWIKRGLGALALYGCAASGALAADLFPRNASEPALETAFAAWQAEEMTRELEARREFIETLACLDGEAGGPMIASGLHFGSLAATRTQAAPCRVRFDYSGLRGVDPDLVVDVPPGLD